MVTGRNLARLARRVDVLLADGAVRPAQVLDALKSQNRYLLSIGTKKYMKYEVTICHLVLSLEVRGQAHVAGGAVEEVLPAADPTDAAAVAVELRLVLIVKQLALVAKVLE